jgi:hypothetical protein
MNERGTCVAMYDYAHYNQTLLNNKSVFIYDSQDIRNESNGLQRIKDNFETYDINCSNYNNDNPVERIKKIDETLEKSGAKYIYMCKSGYNDGIIPTKAKVLVHIMGMVDPVNKHGDVWAYVSYFSSRACSNSLEPVVPYMVKMEETKESLRETLNIPNDSIVIGRHGGMDTFDIRWAPYAVAQSLNTRSNLYYLFLNTPKFIDHPRVIFIDKIVDPLLKAKYINTCDVLLHARDVGETFGMACAEFSAMNKPVMTYFNSPERNHIEILGDKGLYYRNVDELYQLLINFNPDPNVDWNCYKEYTPEKIIKIFNDVYLSIN